ncbi:MAG: type IX secretion system membrane protein PorP/SprF [Methanohalobium sp.]|uniref:PorP/SprF family type IX secretion system membrane protein n=1 Tax=Methanohalobium sp. TaxID=2837493 RepID=UPI00397D1EAD
MIKNKTLIVILLLLFVGVNKALSQNEPMFTQYMFNTLWVNPAYAGTREALNINAMTRLQWVGLDGAPKTYSAAMHTPISNKKVGLGLTVVNDIFGPIKNTYATGNYAYRVTLNEQLTLSMGIKGGINSYYANFQDLKLLDRDDPQFETNEKQINPNLGFGFYLYSKDFYVGFSAPRLLETSLDGNYSHNDFKSRNHYYFIGGFIWELDSKWLFKPSLFTSIVADAPMAYNLSFQFLYDERIWIGGMFRPGDALGAFFNIKVSDRLTVGYGYDYTFTEIANTTIGTHEIMFSFDFIEFKPGKVKSPRYF